MSAWYGLGEEWKKEVGSADAAKGSRKAFYGEKTIRHLGEKFLSENSSSLSSNDIIKKLKDSDILTNDEAVRKASWNKETITAGRLLSEVLRDFFKNKCGSKNPEADTFAALKYLNADAVNADLVHEGESVEIKNGQLIISNADENIIAQGKITGSEAVSDEREIIKAKSTKERKEIMFADASSFTGLDIATDATGAGIAATVATESPDAPSPAFPDEGPDAPKSPFPNEGPAPPSSTFPDEGPDAPRTPEETREFNARMETIGIGSAIRPRIIEGTTSRTKLGYGQPNEVFAITEISSTKKTFTLTVPVKASHDPRFKQNPVADTALHIDISAGVNENPTEIDKRIAKGRKEAAGHVYEIGVTAKTLQGKIGASITMGSGGEFSYTTSGKTYGIELLHDKKIRILITDQEHTPIINLADAAQATPAFFDEKIRNVELVKKRQTEIEEICKRLPPDLQPKGLVINWGNERIASFGINPEHPEKIWLFDAKNEKVGADESAENIYRMLNEKIFYPRVKSEIKDIKLLQDYKEEDTDAVDYMWIKRNPKDKEPIGRLMLEKGSAMNLVISVWKPKFEESANPKDWEPKAHEFVNSGTLENSLAVLFPPIEDQIAARAQAIGGTLEELSISEYAPPRADEFYWLEVYSGNHEHRVGFIKIWKKNPEWLILENAESNRTGKYTGIKELCEAILKLPRGFVETEETEVPIRSEIAPEDKGLDLLKLRYQTLDIFQDKKLLGTKVIFDAATGAYFWKDKSGEKHRILLADETIAGHANNARADAIAHFRADREKIPRFEIVVLGSRVAITLDAQRLVSNDVEEAIKLAKSRRPKKH